MRLRLHWGEPSYPNVLRTYSTTTTHYGAIPPVKWRSTDWFSDRKIYRWYGLSYVRRDGLGVFVGVQLMSRPRDTRSEHDESLIKFYREGRG